MLSLKDEKFQKLLQENTKCFDCQDQNISFASINNGVFLCDICANIHQNIIPEYSIIKSIQNDDWTDDQIKYLQFGGNQKLQQYFNQYSIQENSPIEFKYKTKASQHYRQSLNGIVLQQTQNPSIEEGLQLIYEKNDQQQQNQIINKINNVAEKLEQGFSYTCDEVKKFSQSETGQQIQQNVTNGTKVIADGFWSGFSYLKGKVQEQAENFKQQDQNQANKSKVQYSENLE